MKYLPLALLLPFTACGAPEPEQAAPESPIRVLLVDGQNNHYWVGTTPVLVEALEEEGIFEVTVSTSPPKAPKGEATSPKDKKWDDWKPDFSAYDVVVSNYNGELWPKDIRKAFETFVSNGGGFVSVHAADNAFPSWEAYNEMIGIGGWNGRKRGANDNVWVTVEDGEVIYDKRTKGHGGGHGPRREFVVNHLTTEHPILANLPEAWLHTKDELYCTMCGPAKNMEVLGYSKSNLSKRNEPLLMTITYANGRIFHTTLGHDVEAMRCRGFYETLQRGTEWAAKGQVVRTAEVPDDFPTADTISPVAKPE